jgi:hypothetical protein
MVGAVIAPRAANLWLYPYFGPIAALSNQVQATPGPSLVAVPG